MAEIQKAETQTAEAPEVSAVTGASGFTGRYISSMLLSRGDRVRSLSQNPDGPWDHRIRQYALDFGKPDGLARSLDGADVLYNTYWIRFARGELDFGRAVENSRTLIGAAKAAGVGRVVHVSITNADERSPYPYFRGKGQVEQALRESGISHTILRPAFVFGPGDVLLNNISWLLRKFPVFMVPGDGQYLVQPVFVTDLAGMAVDMARVPGNTTVDAVGPEVLTFGQLVDMVREAVGSRARMIHVPDDGPHGVGPGGHAHERRDADPGRDRRTPRRAAAHRKSCHRGDQAQRVAPEAGGPKTAGDPVRVGAGPALPAGRRPRLVAGG